MQADTQNGNQEVNRYPRKTHAIRISHHDSQNCFILYDNPSIKCFNNNNNNALTFV